LVDGWAIELKTILVISPPPSSGSEQDEPLRSLRQRQQFHAEIRRFTAQVSRFFVHIVHVQIYSNEKSFSFCFRFLFPYAGAGSG
jgi:hypothetical protein